jgi:hypothetical protein
MHRLDPVLWRTTPVQQMQEVAADGVIIGLHIDGPAIVAVVIPVQQHGAQRGHEPISDIAGAGSAVVFFFWNIAAER